LHYNLAATGVLHALSSFVHPNMVTAILSIAFHKSCGHPGLNFRLSTVKWHLRVE
jgi:hypothetical protein